MNFGKALEALKSGKPVARAGWNGKGMFIFLAPGSISIDTFDAMAKEADDGVFTIGGVNSMHFQHGDHGTITRMPVFIMKAADDSVVPGWLASQTDMLAEDWECLA